MTTRPVAAGAVVFDLGNVILSFDHRITCKRLASHYGLEEGVVYRKIFSEGHERKFDLGELSPEEFTEHCARSLGVNLNRDLFKRYWTEIFRENVEVIDLIGALRDRVRLVLLSNTNLWHFEYVQEHFDVLKVFDELVLSFKCGYCKPDVRIFEEAMKAVQYASPAVYVDDISEYVLVAKGLGFEGISFSGAGDLKGRLNDLKLL
jgi:FMN phosphatase YigB (HAD superfamily)